PEGYCAVTAAVSLGKRYVDFQSIFRNTRVGKHFARFFHQFIGTDRVARRNVRQQETLGIRGKRNLRRFLRGRMTGVTSAIALCVAERCLVNQEIGALRGVHRGGAGPRIARERDEATGSCSPDEAISRQLCAVSKLDDLALGEFAPERAFWNAGGFCFLDI